MLKDYLIIPSTGSRSKLLVRPSLESYPSSSTRFIKTANSLSSISESWLVAMVSSDSGNSKRYFSSEPSRAQTAALYIKLLFFAKASSMSLRSGE
jgi:hypothetical protein